MTGKSLVQDKNYYLGTVKLDRTGSYTDYPLKVSKSVDIYCSVN